MRWRRVPVLCQVMLAALLAALDPLVWSASAQIIAGGLFDKVAGETDREFRNLARWDGVLPGSTNQWIKTTSADSANMFTAADRVRSLAFDPIQRWLLIGGMYKSDLIKGSLLRATLPGPSPLEPLYYFFCEAPRPGTVYALEYWAQSGQAWEVFAGGDFDAMSESHGDLNPPKAQFVARCQFGSSKRSCQTLPPEAAASSAGAPDSPVRMLAFDSNTQILYVGAVTGGIRKYKIITETWSLLDPTVGIGTTARPLNLLFDRTLGLGFIAFAGASGVDETASGRNGVRVFARGAVDLEGNAGQSRGSSFPSLQNGSVHFTALTIGVDTVHNRRGVFAAGNQSNCPALWFLPLDGNSPKGWQPRDLHVGNGGCANSSDVEGEHIVERLAFAEHDNVLIMAGNFHTVSGTYASNIAISRDAGRTWGALATANSQGLTVQQPLGAGAAVSAVIVIPQVDVNSVEPTHLSPMGGDILTLTGTGFMAFPESTLKITIGKTECHLTYWLSDVKATCKVAAWGLGQGDSLNAYAGVSTSSDLAFQRRACVLSYSAPILGKKGRLTHPVSLSIGGNEDIIVFGKNFGMHGDLREVNITIGDTLCTNGKWISDSSLRCQVPAGAIEGQVIKTMGLTISANISGRPAQPSAMRFSYLPPEVTGSDPSEIPTTGIPGPNPRVTLLGKSFGSQDTVPRSIKLGETTCHSKAGWTSDTALACTAPGPGVGFMSVILTVASQACTMGCSHLQGSSSLLKYAAPIVTSGVPYPPQLPPGGGGGVITIQGSGFGSKAGLASVSIGDTKCASLHWQSDAKILCMPTPPGAGARLELKVEVQGQVGVAKELLQYEDPFLISFTPSLLPFDGGARVTVRGSSFVKVCTFRLFLGARRRRARA